jgi:hypothetical protein
MSKLMSMTSDLCPIEEESAEPTNTLRPEHTVQVQHNAVGGPLELNDSINEALLNDPMINY